MSGNRSKRFCFEKDEECLSLGENNKYEKDNQDELIDLTQTTPTPPFDLTQATPTPPPEDEENIQIPHKSRDVSSNPSDVNLQHHEEEGVQVSKPIVISDSDEIVHDGVDNDEQSEDVVTALKRLTSRLQEHELSEDDIVSVLVELAQLEVTVPDLLETGAGKVVRRMKEKEGKVGRLAARLVIRFVLPFISKRADH